MRKSVKFMLVMAAAIGIVAVSCNKEDKGSDPNYNSKEGKTIAEWVKEGIEVDMQSHVVEINVKADGKWNAVAEPDDNWLSMNTVALSYNGPSQLLLCIDENRTEADRKSVLYIEDSKGEFYEIPVRQNYNFNGEPPTNGSGAAFVNNGVGFGVDYDYVLDTKGIAKRNYMEDVRIANKQMKEEERTQFSPTKVKKNNPIFNIDQIQRLMSAEGQNKLSKQTYIENEIPFVDLYAKLMDSTVCQAKHLLVGLELGVSFGCIEFTASAGYESNATEERQKMDYTIVRNSPIYNVTLSEAEVSNYAEKAMYEARARYENGVKEINADIKAYEEANLLKTGKKDLTKMQQKIINGKWKLLEEPNFDNVFSASFADIYWDLFNAVVEEDEAKIDAVMTKVDSYYGPFYISGGDFGGAMTIHAEIDNLSMEGDVDFHGELDADFGGAFHVYGTFEYTENGMALMRDANARFYIYGGDANKVSDMMTSIMLGDNPTDRDAWSDAITYWIQTMYSNNEHVDLSKAAPISFVMTPIWNLFWDEDMHTVAKDWFLKKYESRGILDYFGIMTGDLELGAEGLMEKVSAELREEGYDI